jgi:hypothetical protein
VEEFELYLVKRKKRGRQILVGAGVFLVASIAIPYALMRSGLLRPDTFDIFVFLDIFLGACAVRAGVMRLKDAGKWAGPMPFS